MEFQPLGGRGKEGERENGLWSQTDGDWRMWAPPLAHSCAIAGKFPNLSRPPGNTRTPENSLRATVGPSCHLCVPGTHWVLHLEGFAQKTSELTQRRDSK